MWRKNGTFSLWFEPGTGASLLKMWRKKFALFFCGLNLEQVLAYWKCGEKKRTFFCALNLEQVLAYWKCGEKNRIFFLRSELATRASLLKMWGKNRTFFFALNLEQVLAYWKCGEKNLTFFAFWTWNRCQLTENVEKKSHFFLRCEPGTGASLLKMWRKNRLFFCAVNLEQVLAYWKCGEKIALFFALWTWNRC